MAYAWKTGHHGAFVATSFLVLDHLHASNPRDAPKVTRVVLPTACHGIGFAEGKWAMCTFHQGACAKAAERNRRKSVPSCVFAKPPVQRLTAASRLLYFC
jgi:hypothetical protein